VVIVRDSANIQASLVQSPLKGPCRMPLGVVRFSKNQANVTLSKLEVLNSRKIRLPGSDHRAVVADIRIAT
jgi:hypothetical protein